MEDEYTYTRGMTDEEVAEVLSAADTGTLALADGDDAYAVPMAIHYDGERVLFHVGDRPDSKKMRFIDATETATLVVYEAPTPDEAWSVLVEGNLREATPDERAAVTDPDDLFVPLRIFGEPIEDVEPALYVLEVDLATGRRVA
ncbi:MAG: pyridoxamine 5'-phosphate oxidase family protein [Haloarculaceae archaeon]